MSRAEDSAADDITTLVAGATLCVADRDGSIRPETWQGLYHHDRRMLSSFALHVDGRPPPLLSSHRDGAGTAHRVHLLASDPYGSPTALLRVRRRVTTGLLCEEYTVEAFAGALHGVALAVEVGADFADLLARKHDLPDLPSVPFAAEGPGWMSRNGSAEVTLQVLGPPATLEGTALRWSVDAAPGAPWEAALEIRTGDPGGTTAAGGAPRPRLGLGLDTVLSGWRHSVGSAVADLEGLRVDVPGLGLSYLGAGAPWFMALFGRDTLLAAWESLLTGSGLALDVLESLARYQGRTEDPRTGEQPGRILHELRTGGSSTFGLPPGEAYYGTVDASPLFVMLLDEAAHWGADERRVAALLPAARAALRWCTEYGDIDGDGFVEYAGDARGLANQGWKDSGDAMVHADGSQAPPPIALAEVQSYVVAAHRALAVLEERWGDPALGPGLRAAADGRQQAFQEAFWLPRAGVLAMALDRDKRPLAVASSNMGHCLWAGALDADVGAAVADRLIQPDLLARWGVRTLGAGEVAYNPLGYHLGSIWPHDAALAAAGLMRYGHVGGARRVVDGLLTTAEHFGWRLPELFGGFDAGDVPYPVPYPVACSPQAWSAAAPLLLLRTVLRIAPDVPAGRVHVAPVLTEDADLVLTGIPLGTGTLDVRVRRDEVEVLHAPDGIEVIPALPPDAISEKSS